MHPFLHTPVLNLSLPLYQLSILTGLTLCFLWARSTAAIRHFNHEINLQNTLITLNIGILGAHFCYLIAFKTTLFIHNPFIFFHFNEGGLTSYGALIFITVSLFIYTKIKQKPALDTLDSLFTLAPIMIIFFRIGCFFAGCCFGKPTTSWLHFTFNNPHTLAGQTYPNTPLIPVQFYNMLNGLFLFFLLNWLYPRRQFSGQVTTVFFIIYPINRGLLDFLRGDEASHGIFFHNTVSITQLMGLSTLVIGIVTYYFLQKQSAATHTNMQKHELEYSAN